MNSSLYFGEVQHQRFSPKKHGFRYKLFMPHLFLDEIPEVLAQCWFCSVNRPNLTWFRREDYHKPECTSLEDAVLGTMSEQLGEEVKGRISMLTHLRTFGHCFNPVTFYYCWEDDLSAPKALMAEITNTPWHERYAKCFFWNDSDTPSGKSRHTFRKEFHVSPFIGMNIAYDWRFQVPAENLKIDMILQEEGEVLFTANLHMEQRPLTNFQMNLALLQFPFLTMKVTTGIYWNALRLKLMGTPFYPHPETSTQSDYA